MQERKHGFFTRLCSLIFFLIHLSNNPFLYTIIFPFLYVFILIFTSFFILDKGIEGEKENLWLKSRWCDKHGEEYLNKV
ncbi:hypothetical protein SU69_05580 [Thermosipho melanesiensis]|uniref:Uncharacterized protein n=1 Tax=Thermosipho melanesiensis TaxID=46541 RepID=A0ABM6GGU8_9BACT|nr:hypothetical protein BW47_05850 [Thermosipho melanesiensis]OOC35996.1 hypothetical protein SU68_05640 [Thermosipho melanesiensis]OOC38135.1 hypothetical protein SU69_05580 [Thermosipho melanesiensis]OOC38264.1 hypothetical protein SU70_05590 [Thermosipho melanesiensis]OOC41364.1 hypothetical protein SU71_05570 [Thermosipho melanesiensis]